MGDWNQGTDFMVTDRTNTKVTFTMHCKEHKERSTLHSSKAKAEERVLGEISFQVSDLVPDPEDELHRHLKIQTITLPGTTIELKLRLQLRFVGAASCVLD